MSAFPPSADARAGRGGPRDDLAALRPTKPILATDVDLGQALRQARESLDLGQEDIAQATHVRAQFIDALERLDLAALPAGPFAAGYARAYARALGLDPDSVVARLRHEAPSEEARLREPLGGEFRSRARFRGLIATARGVVAALAAWTFAVRVKAPGARVQAADAPAPVVAQPAAGPTVLGAPLPAPPEASTPPPYETPGLAEATAAKGPDAGAAAAARIAEEAAQAHPPEPVAPGAPFVAHGAVYGVSHGGAGVVLQAIRPMSLVVRGAGGTVYFARQLRAGDAWRAPDLAGLTIDVDVPAAVEVYAGGRASGLLTAPQTPLAALVAPKPAFAATAQ
ncbi:MAG TPA: helix-turn-helix domain-containing protein [Caulobacteraceae bacterium]